MKHLELLHFSLNFSACALLTTALFLISNATKQPDLKHYSFLIICFFISLSTFALLRPRITNIVEIIQAILQPSLFLLLFTLLLTAFLPPSPNNTTTGNLPIIAVASASGLLCFLIVMELTKRTKFFHNQTHRAMAQEIFEASRSRAKTPSFNEQISRYICSSYRCTTAHLANETKAAFESPRLTMAKDSAALKELKSLGWATPESLHRRRPTENSGALAEFLQTHQLGALLCIPANSPEPSLVMGIGVRQNEDPFTYAEILQLQQAGDLIEYTLIRSRLAVQAELTERMERLAVVSRGLAHDLKNLITPLATFLNHTRDSHQTSGDVHGSASRALVVITDYIDDALFFTDKRQLRLVATDVKELLGTVSAIVGDRARKRHVRLEINAAGCPAAPADATLLQRLLSNLVNNAIDASSPGSTVTVSGTSLPNGGFRFAVTDQGCGIPAENLSRIFEPYFTTKVYGESSRGFGLGLTICQKIAELHHGSISVTSQVGRGTEMRVHLPGLAMAA